MALSLQKALLITPMSLSTMTQDAFLKPAAGGKGAGEAPRVEETDLAAMVKEGLLPSGTKDTCEGASCKSDPTEFTKPAATAPCAPKEAACAVKEAALAVPASEPEEPPPVAQRQGRVRKIRSESAVAVAEEEPASKKGKKVAVNSTAEAASLYSMIVSSDAASCQDVANLMSGACHKAAGAVNVPDDFENSDSEGGAASAAPPLYALFETIDGREFNAASSAAADVAQPDTAVAATAGVQLAAAAAFSEAEACRRKLAAAAARGEVGAAEASRAAGAPAPMRRKGKPTRLPNTESAGAAAARRATEGARREKMRLEFLQRQIDSMLEEQKSDEKRAVTAEFLRARVEGAEDDEHWGELLSPHVIFAKPHEPYLLPFGGDAAPPAGSVVGASRWVEGIDAIVADAEAMRGFGAALAARALALAPGAPALALRCDVQEGEVAVAGERVVCDFRISTEGLVGLGSAREASIDGMLRGVLDGELRLVEVELAFDVLRFAQDLDACMLLDPRLEPRLRGDAAAALSVN